MHSCTLWVLGGTVPIRGYQYYQSIVLWYAKGRMQLYKGLAVHVHVRRVLRVQMHVMSGELSKTPGAYSCRVYSCTCSENWLR